MKFTSAEAIESIVWQSKLADYPRAVNRGKINDVFNGFPPYSDEEVTANNLATNVNFLEGAKMAHDARRQFYNAFLAPSPLFTVELDYGPIWKRKQWANIITKEINKIIKESSQYAETRRSIFALNVLHGIGPSVWPNGWAWRPVAKGIEDVLIPSGTMLDMDNLPFFAVYQQFTGAQLRKAISGPRIDPGWKKDVAEKAIAWVDQQAQTLMSASWPEVWSPEKMEERIKEDSGLYSSDRVPTIDCWRFFWWNEEGKQAGWSQKIVLDAWGNPGLGFGGTVKDAKPTREDGKYGLNSPAFLYDAGNRKFASKLSELVHFQFADASSVAPFRYHSVRSLGFLLYSVCHLQNRLRCKFSDALFESLMQYFRVTNPSDAERALKVNLTEKTPIPDGINFIKPEERWQVDKQLVEMGLQMNRSLMDENSASYIQDIDSGSPSETATRTMAKVNASASLVGAMLNQAYTYQKYQYNEISRRFCKSNSRDPDIRRFRNNVLKQGVPEEVLNVALWNIEPVRVIGGGNKTMQVAMADKLMMIYSKLDPQAQTELKRMYIAVNTEDYELAFRWVPEVQKTSPSTQEALQTFGTLMQGVQVPLRDGANHEDEINALFGAMIQILQRFEEIHKLPTMDQILGLFTVGQHIGLLISKMEEDAATPTPQGFPQDDTLKEKVKAWSDDLAQIMNQVKGYAQRVKEQEAANAANTQGDPAAAAKVQATIIQAQTKSKIAEESHAQRTAQRQVQFENQIEQQRQQHELDMQTQAERDRLELASRATEIELERQAQAQTAEAQPLGAS